MTTFTLTETHLRRLFSRARLPFDASQMTLIGLRGVSPADGVGGKASQSVQVSTAAPDYIHPRCSIGWWRPGDGFALHPGSTVPHASDVKQRIPAAGAGVNQLCLGLHEGYAKGMHPQSRPKTRHRALRMNKAIPVQRTAADMDFDGDDRLDYATAYDNIHCGWTASAQSSKYSSLGCQVVVGFALPETGPWAKFIGAVYANAQQTFNYALFTGAEVQRTANTAAADPLPATLRYGSRDVGGATLVRDVQTALANAGYLSAAPDGSFGFRTLAAVYNFQREAMNQRDVDGLVGEQTAAKLGLPNWPTA